MAVQLKHKIISTELFNLIVERYPSRVVKIEESNIFECFRGTRFSKNNKGHKIYTDGKKHIIIERLLLNNLLPENERVLEDTWKEIHLELDEEEEGLVCEDKMTGSQAYVRLRTLLRKAYTDAEVEEILKSYTDTHDDDLKQIHEQIALPSNKVWRAHNCVKYDINGAHAYFLIQMFPKARAILEAYYELKNKYKAEGNAQEAQKIKDTFNLSVGMLKHRGFDGAYYWIVHQTTLKMREAMRQVGGILLYANTDGFCVMNPEGELQASNKLGDFKLEAKGDYYIYSGGDMFSKGTGYTLHQFIDVKGNQEKKGSCMKVLHNRIDLFSGKIVYYKRTLKKVSDISLYVAEDVEDVVLPIQDLIW